MENIEKEESIQENNETKKINVIFESKEDVKEKKKKNEKRVITGTKKWKSLDIEQFSYDKQKQLIENIQKNVILDEIREPCSLIIQNIKQKLSSYKMQDIKKNKLDILSFVSFDDVLKLLIEEDFNCHYCKEKVNLLYEIVRESKQWTLDRIDNDYGHNKNNLFLSCLTCNLRRKTMYHEKYVFTKQMKIIKMD